jgi:hypothetical protein
MIQALASQRLSWLSGVAPSILAELRMNNENATFRSRLQNAMSRLQESQLTDVDKVTAEVCHEIDTAILEHDRDVRAIAKKFQRAHGQTLVTAVGAAGAALIPSLAPFLGVAAPLAVAAKYGADKIAERAEKQAVTKSLIGVLASVRSTED